jgi:hypothetical protein
MPADGRPTVCIEVSVVPPGYGRVIVWDRHAGHDHPTDILHAWRRVHMQRDLKDLHVFEPGVQCWANTGLMCGARTGRANSASALDEQILAAPIPRSRPLARDGFAN